MYIMIIAMLGASCYCPVTGQTATSTHLLYLYPILLDNYHLFLKQTPNQTVTPTHFRALFPSTSTIPSSTPLSLTD